MRRTHSQRNRRGRLTFVMVVVLAFASATAAQATDAPPSTEPPPTAGDGASPTPGGVLRFARNQEPGTLNPIGAADNGAIFTIHNIFDQLVEVGHEPNPQPGLAESWTTSDDGLVWDFTLREATFSNGNPVTAEDVKFSLDRWADPEINVNYAGLASSVDTVEVLDPSTVRVTLERPDGAFLDNLAMFVASIIPQDVFEELGPEQFGEAPVGSGPFMVESWTRGQSLELVRNPHYWGAPQPYLDGVSFRFVLDDSTRMLQLQNDEVDIVESVPYAQIERLEELPNVTVLSEPLYKWDAIWFNLNVAPLDELAVRQALNYATPKEQILETVLFGRGDIANNIIARVKYNDDSLAPYPYDLDMARSLMAESSVPDGFDLQLLIVGGDVVERQTAEILQSAWAEIGVNVEIEQTDIGTAFTRWLTWPNEEMAATFPGSALSSDTLSDDNLAFVFLDPDAGLHSFGTGYDNPEVVRLVREANETIDDATRRELFQQAQALALADAPAVPLFFTQVQTGLHDRVQGFRSVPMGWWLLREVWLERE